MLVGGVSQGMEFINSLAPIWKEANADLLMVRIGASDITRASFLKLAQAQEEHQLRVLLHPADDTSSISFTPSDPSCHPLLLQKLSFLADSINEHGFHPLIILHPPRIATPGQTLCGKEVLPESEALKNSLPFFSKLAILQEEKQVPFSIEIMHDPFRHHGHAILGYTVEQMRALCTEKFSICIDTGHAKLSQTSVGAWLESGLKISAVHFQGNDGSTDSHELPNSSNVGDVSDIERLLALQAPTILECNSKNLLAQLAKNKKETLALLSETIELAKEGVVKE
ncbi:MAG: TIM barrel protein [Candidatus Micrarchaeota archaeon]